jgi:hypothetical protein
VSVLNQTSGEVLQRPYQHLGHCSFGAERANEKGREWRGVSWKEREIRWDQVPLSIFGQGQFSASWATNWAGKRKTALGATCQGRNTTNRSAKWSSRQTRGSGSRILPPQKVDNGWKDFQTSISLRIRLITSRHTHILDKKTSILTTKQKTLVRAIGNTNTKVQENKAITATEGIDEQAKDSCKPAFVAKVGS